MLENVLEFREFLITGGYVIFAAGLSSRRMSETLLQDHYVLAFVTPRANRKLGELSLQSPSRHSERNSDAYDRVAIVRTGNYIRLNSRIYHSFW